MTKKEEYINAFNDIIQKEMFSKKLKLLTDLDEGFDYSEIILEDVYYDSVNESNQEKTFYTLVHRFKVDGEIEEIDFPHGYSEISSVHLHEQYRFVWDSFNGADVEILSSSSLCSTFNQIEFHHKISEECEKLLEQMEYEEEKRIAISVLPKAQLCFPRGYSHRSTRCLQH